MKEKKDRVDDALHATRAALDEGIVPGGGVALLNAKTKAKCSPLSDADEQLGCDIVMNAIEKPFIQILKNAGINKYHGILAEIESKKGKGYDIKKSQ